MVAIYVTVAISFFASIVKYFSATLDCLDYAYDEISIVPTKLISNLVLRDFLFLLERSYEVF